MSQLRQIDHNSLMFQSKKTFPHGVNQLKSIWDIMWTEGPFEHMENVKIHEVLL